jgi:hypothetical protein
MDFTRHNAEQVAVWAAFNAGTPTRVPMTIACNPRMILLDPTLNPRGITFEQCFTDPTVMFDVDLQFTDWLRHAMPCDIERGLPEQWAICPNFQNVGDAAWLGSPLHYFADGVPDTRPILTDDNKRLLFDRGIPDPFTNLMGTARNYLDYYQERAARETYRDRPITVVKSSPGLGFDGPFTLACNLRGATEFCVDLYEDPEYAQELLGFLVEAITQRQRAWRNYLGYPQERQYIWFADDSIALLSCEAYRELVLPHHKQFLYTDRAPDATLCVHLCGDSSRHFVIIRDALGANRFDTGFPIDHGAMRAALGPEIVIEGGPHVDLLLHGTPEEVAGETRRILRSGVMDGGKFILKEANNLAPRTPMANLQAMYDTCKVEGIYAPVSA